MHDKTNVAERPRSAEAVESRREKFGSGKSDAPATIPYAKATRILSWCRRVLLRMILRPWRAAGVVKLGTRYGGWYVPVGQVGSDAICYSVGLGEDASFDFELLRRTGCQVFAFDPTPRAVAFAASLSSPRFSFVPLGVWSSDAELRFYAPKNPKHVSHSVVNLQGTDEYFVASCRSISSLMTMLRHERLTLLKLDVEGAEYEILRSLRDANVQPLILCVEFDQPTPLRRILAEVRECQRFGYAVVAVDGWNVTFTVR